MGETIFRIQISNSISNNVGCRFYLCNLCKQIFGFHFYMHTKLGIFIYPAQNIYVYIYKGRVFLLEKMNLYNSMGNVDQRLSVKYYKILVNQRIMLTIIQTTRLTLINLSVGISCGRLSPSSSLVGGSPQPPIRMVNRPKESSALDWD